MAITWSSVRFRSAVNDDIRLVETFQAIEQGQGNDPLPTSVADHVPPLLRVEAPVATFPWSVGESKDLRNMVARVAKRNK